MKFLNHKLMLNILIIMFIVSVIFSALTTVGFAFAPPPKVGPQILCDYEYCGTFRYIGRCYMIGVIGYAYEAPRYEVKPPNCRPVQIDTCWICSNLRL